LALLVSIGAAGEYEGWEAASDDTPRGEGRRTAAWVALNSRLVTGTHRGQRSSRWQLLLAVAASLVGRGYAGRHRLADAVLDRPLPERSDVSRAASACTPAAARPVVVPRLTLVPAGTSPFAARRA
jgi:hypothetical protein